jgi:hypothetical protein
MIRHTTLVLLFLFSLAVPAHADELYLHAAEAVSVGNTSTFGSLDGQQYWQSQSPSAQLIFPVSLRAGDTILDIEVFIENTVTSAQIVALRRKTMSSTGTALVGTVTSPSSTGNHTVLLGNLSEEVAGDNQWYIRIMMGTVAGNRVRGARITYEPAPAPVL